jgi:PAS domain S-box-containing protein
MFPKKSPLFLLWVLPVLVIIILFSSSFRMWKETQDLSHDLLRSVSKNYAEQIKTRLELFLFERRKDLTHLASLKQKYSLSEFLHLFKTDASGIVSRDKNYLAISFTDSSANVLVSTGLDTINDSTSPIYNLNLDSILEKLSADTAMILTTVNTSENRMLLFMLKPVFLTLGKQNFFTGAVVASMKVEELLKGIVSVSIDETNFVQIFAGDTLLYESGLNQKNLQNEFSEAAKSQVSYYTMQRKFLISVFPPINGLLERLIRQNNLRFITNAIASIIISTILALALFVSYRLRITTSELARSEERYRHLAENASDMIIEQTIPQGTYEYVSPAAERLTGYKPSDFYATPFLFEKILIPEYKEQYRVQWQNTLEGKTPQTSEFSIIHKSGEQRWLSQRNSLILKNGTLVAVEGILTDVTAQKKAALEREMLIRELEIKNRDLERFTYIISHELKTPLITIKGFLGYLEDEAFKGDFSGLHQDILRILGATETMSHLLNDLAVLNRIGHNTTEKRNVRIKDIVQKCIGYFSRQIKEKSIRVIVSANLPEVKAYPGELFELYKNLLDNSIKFIDSHKSPVIEIGIKEVNKEQVLFVKDNGKGFESKYSDRIFGLFNKLDAGTAGTGAGLTMAKKIVEHHGGWIKAESAGPGKGTEISFTIPQ